MKPPQRTLAAFPRSLQMELKARAFPKGSPAPGRTRPGPGPAGRPQPGRLPSHRGPLGPAEAAPGSGPPCGRLRRGGRRRAPAGRSPHSAHLRRSPPPLPGRIGAAGKEEEQEEVLSPGEVSGRRSGCPWPRLLPSDRVHICIWFFRSVLLLCCWYFQNKEDFALMSCLLSFHPCPL